MNVVFLNDGNIQDGVRIAILDYHFVDSFVESHNKKQKFCWFVSCKVFYVGLGYIFRMVEFEMTEKFKMAFGPLSWNTGL